MNKEVHQDELPFQVAPMIDIIFILILFFMVTAGTQKVEKELTINLPGEIKFELPVKMIDEQIVQIETDGQVVLNDQTFALPTEKDMPQLKTTLMRFKEMSEMSKTIPLLTISTSPKAKYERVIDVLNVCAAAKIENVTFATMGE
jgi:biopolymer transport protein ExbD